MFAPEQGDPCAGLIAATFRLWRRPSSNGCGVGRPSKPGGRRPARQVYKPGDVEPAANFRQPAWIAAIGRAAPMRQRE